MIQQYHIRSINELEKVAKQLAALRFEYNIMGFFGPMGAGKTTLIKEVCKLLGCRDNVSSPTFSLVNEYLSEEDMPIYHFDFYRIEKLDEVYDIGYEDYFYSSSLCLIEWPEKILQLMPEKYVTVSLSLGLEAGERFIEVKTD